MANGDLRQSVLRWHDLSGIYIQWLPIAARKFRVLRNRLRSTRLSRRRYGRRTARRDRIFS